MAVLGYCRVCDRLVPLKQGKHKGEGRERWWWPVEHDTPEGKPCEGVKRGI